MTTLSADRVEEIFRDCLCTEEEFNNDAGVVALGLMAQFAFSPERLESHRDEVYALLCELPDTFQQHTGGGQTFLEACFDKHGEQWGEQIYADQLFTLGTALNLVTEPLKGRVPVDALPGGVPYYMVKSLAQIEVKAKTDD